MSEVIGPYTVTDERLGEGGQVAVKKFAFARAFDLPDAGERTSKYTRLKREVENAWKVSGHPNVVTLCDVCFDEQREFLCLVMELGEGRDLFESILSSGRLSEEQAASWFYQIAVAVRWVHIMGVCHRDLKLENVLLHADGTVKLADFGMSKDFSQSLVETRTRIGTLAYLAPELFAAGAEGATPYEPEPMDVWAMGVMLYVMVCADYPFGTDQVWDARRRRWAQNGQARMACVGAIMTGAIKEGGAWPSLSPELQDMIRGCLRVNPRERFTIEMVRAHPLLASTAAAAPPQPPSYPVRERDWASFWPAPGQAAAAPEQAAAAAGGGGGGGGFAPSEVTLPTVMSFGSDSSLELGGSVDLDDEGLMGGLPSIDSLGGLPFQASGSPSGDALRLSFQSTPSMGDTTDMAM